MRAIGDRLPRRLKAKASGAIAAGKPLIVEADGDVAQISGNDLAQGSANEFDTNNSSF